MNVMRQTACLIVGLIMVVPSYLARRDSSLRLNLSSQSVSICFKRFAPDYFFCVRPIVVYPAVFVFALASDDHCVIYFVLITGYVTVYIFGDVSLIH